MASSASSVQPHAAPRPVFRGHILSRTPADRDSPRLRGMLVLPVVAISHNSSPAVRLDQANHVSHLHLRDSSTACIMMCTRHCQTGLRLSGGPGGELARRGDRWLQPRDGPRERPQPAALRCRRPDAATASAGAVRGPPPVRRRARGHQATTGHPSGSKRWPRASAHRLVHWPGQAARKRSLPGSGATGGSAAASWSEKLRPATNVTGMARSLRTGDVPQGLGLSIGRILATTWRVPVGAP